MAEKMIKFRAFHFYEAQPALGLPGQEVLVERQAFLGQVVDIPREEDVQRGELLEAFYSDEEREAIEDGTYDGPDRYMLSAPPVGEAIMSPSLTGEEAASRTPVPSAEAEPINAMAASSEQIADYIGDNNLTVPQTVALAGGNPDVAEKIIEAENIATDNDPRTGVITAMEKLSAEASGGAGE